MKRHTPKRWNADETKMRELVLYISQRCARNPKFGATKLNKILYFSDYLSYAISGKPITGFEYQKLRKGPAPRNFVPLRDAMIREGDLKLKKVRLLSGKTQHRTIPLRLPNLSLFTRSQITLVNNVIDQLWDRDAEYVSKVSHKIAWQLPRMNGTIPYETVFISDSPLTRSDVEWAREVAREHAL